MSPVGMSPTGQGAIYLSLFLTGLAGSLHCVGMCGPILLGFSRALGRHGRSGLEFFYYHGGRLWTYGLLGLLAGWAGSGLRQEAIQLGWQRPLAVLLSLLVMVSGAAALGWIPGLRFELSSPGACLGGARRWPWLTALLRQPTPSARLLLGAAMGLLPCGLVYAALVVAATLPSPAHSAAAMLCFGAGTLPALSALVLGGRLVPLKWRRDGTRVTAAVLVVVGLFMLGRALGIPSARAAEGSDLGSEPSTHCHPAAAERFLSGGS